MFDLIGEKIGMVWNMGKLAVLGGRGLVNLVKVFKIQQEARRTTVARRTKGCKDCERGE